MTHEFENILRNYRKAQKKGLTSVLATVVYLEGSSYRKPGVRMLITSDDKMTGAVSGGCVEKEVLFQSRSVFESSIPKIMTYDGRYRLGCEGILYILIEPFDPGEDLFNLFFEFLEERKPFQIKSYFRSEFNSDQAFGSEMVLGDSSYSFRSEWESKNHTGDLNIFEQKLNPDLQLLIIGAEHDAVELSKLSTFLGWRVQVVCDPKNQQSIKNFPGAHKMIPVLPEDFKPDLVEERTAVVLMNHSYAKDLHFLEKLFGTQAFYIGILGPVKRREKLLNEIIEKNPEISLSFLDKIFAPAGLNIGSTTPQEIALSICAEILSVFKKEQPIFLKDKVGSIHSSCSNA